MLDPLETINAIFKEHNKACPVVAYEVECHHMSRPRRRMIYRQLSHDLGSDFQITYNPNRLRIVQLPTHRAAA